MINFDSLDSVIVKNALETVKNTVTLGFILTDKKEFVNVMCGGQKNSPKDVAVGIWESVNRDFANVIRLWTLRWGDSPGIYGWFQNNQKGLSE